MKKVADYCRELCARGLLDRDEACRVALVAGLMPTLSSSAAAPAATGASGEMLMQAAGLSPTELREQLEHLRSLGFAVEPAGACGYRLAAPFSHLVVAEAVLPLLLAQVDPASLWVAGLPYRYHARCGSTNLVLKEEAASSPAGTLVVADEQTLGRGRLGRSWSSCAGEDLTFSVLLRPCGPVAQAPLLSLAAALAVAEVLEALHSLGGRVQVKWPNDVLVDDKKVCGILLESCMDGDRLQWAIAGIGLNVNSDPSSTLKNGATRNRQEWRGKPRPTSLRAEMGVEVARGALLAELLVRLTLRWAQPSDSHVLEGLRARDALLGRRVEVLAGSADGALVVAGEAVGIGAQGELLVRDHMGKETPVFAGEVTVRAGE